MSKLTKLVQNKENRKSFFKFIILLEKRISTIKIKMINLINEKDLNIASVPCSFHAAGPTGLSISNLGL